MGKSTFHTHMLMGHGTSIIFTCGHPYPLNSN